MLRAPKSIFQLFVVQCAPNPKPLPYHTPLYSATPILCTHYIAHTHYCTSFRIPRSLLAWLEARAARLEVVHRFPTPSHLKPKTYVYMHLYMYICHIPQTVYVVHCRPPSDPKVRPQIIQHLTSQTNNVDPAFVFFLSPRFARQPSSSGQNGDFLRQLSADCLNLILWEARREIYRFG